MDTLVSNIMLISHETTRAPRKADTVNLTAPSEQEKEQDSGCCGGTTRKCVAFGWLTNGK